MTKLWQFLQCHPKPAFSVKVQRGEQGKFFKNRPKRSPRLKGPKAHWRKWHYPLICTHLKCKHFGANSASKSVRMAKLWQFSRGHSKPAFSEKVKRGDQGKFFKNRSNSKPRLKGWKALFRKWYYPQIIMHLRAKTGDDFGATSGFKSARMAKLWQFSQGHPKPHFLKKCKGRCKGNVSKIAQKLAIVWKA